MTYDGKVPERKDAGNNLIIDSQKLFEILKGDNKSVDLAQATPQGGDKVRDIGQVSTLTLPDNFEKGQETGGTAGTNSFREYHSKDDPSIQLYFEYRGMRTTPEAAKAFQDVLKDPPHVLKQSEINSLTTTLRDKGYPEDFKIMVAKTQDINGKRVLSVEGEYAKHKLMARTLFVDSDNTGSAVQEITFQAPSDKFMKNIPKGAKALESIQWK